MHEAQLGEIEIARMKLANLREAVITNDCQSQCTSSQTVIADGHSGELPYQTTDPLMMQSTTIPAEEVYNFLFKDVKEWNAYKFCGRMTPESSCF